VLVHTAPQPKDHVRLVEGVPYQVPADKVLTLKGFLHGSGSTNLNSATDIDVDGQSYGVLFGYDQEMEEIPFGITIPSGSTVTPVDVSVNAGSQGPAAVLVYGYLSDA
jgi:hypothetical protein